MGFVERLKDSLPDLARAPGAAFGAAIGEMRVGAANFRARYFPRGAVVLKADPSRKDASPPDPAKLFSPTSASPAIDRNASLGDQLQHCARGIVERREDVAAQARNVARAIEDRIDGEATLITQGIRSLIVFGWAFLAFVLAWSHATGDAWTSFLGPVAADARLPLAEAFGIIAAAGFAVAMLRSGIVFALGKGDNQRLRREAHRLGELAADVALGFEAALDEARRSMDDRANAADAVRDLSRAHLTALEAAVFFRSLPFLGDGDRETARLKFAGYLKSVFGSPAPEGFALPAGLIGFFIGALYMRSLYPEAPALPIATPLPAIAAYGWASAAILGGAMAYVLCGMIVDAFRGPFTALTRSRARDEAVDAVRSAFLARNAPRIESVIQRIADALEVYRARVSRSADSAAFADDETPTWRKAPEGPRFVGTTFASAPKPFLADPGKRKK